MSLLDRGGGYEPCAVYLETTRVDEDGNTLTVPATTPVETLGWFQVRNQSGTSSRRTEQNDEGFITEQVYSVQFTRAFTAAYGELGASTVIEWREDSSGRPARWSVFGDAQRYTGSRGTKHVVYTLRRA